ncbi:MAG: chromate transporter [Firmicutes bacterium]|nr:chromate transporter [Bacillota bacterium]
MSEKKSKLAIIFELYTTFFKLGLFCFGGGYAAVPLFEREIVEEKKWIGKEKIIDIFAVAQSLPGAIALNSAAFVGYSVAGLPGAIAALLGNLTPSTIIMLILSMLFSQFNENLYVQKAFNGIRPIIVGLITYAAFKIGKTAIKDIYCALIAIIAFVLAVVFHVSVIFIILGGIAAGILLTLYKSLSNTDQYRHISKDGE